MSETKPSSEPGSASSSPSPLSPPRRRLFDTRAFFLIVIAFAAVTFAIAALLTSIFQRKQEAKNPWVRMVEVDENTSDPAKWGVNWTREYNAYLRTVDNTRTKYGGSESFPAQKSKTMPFLTRMFAGYAFAIDYRERRGHAFMLADQEQTRRVNEKPQPGACLHCHASITPTWRRLGDQALGKPFDEKGKSFDWDAVFKGFQLASAMSYTQAHAELLKTPDGTPEASEVEAGGSSVSETTPANSTGAATTLATSKPTTRELLAHQTGQAHPVACLDCHDPKSMELRVTRPGFVNGIRALAMSSDPVPHLPSIERWRAGDRKIAYDPNVDASRQEMRSFVCGQCHVEYYCGPKVTLFFPWNNGLKVEQIESYYDSYKFPDGHRFYDWQHAETGAEVLKAQHPEFEMWSQGVHARAGVACADCHMPYMRQGALKISDHWVRSPLLADNINRACQTCHRVSETELLERAETIQGRTVALMQRSGTAIIDLLDGVKRVKAAGVSAAELKPVLELQRKAQWRLDFVAAENSMGFHASQESARILGEAIDYARQGQVLTQQLAPSKPAPPTSAPSPVAMTTETSEKKMAQAP